MAKSAPKKGAPSAKKATSSSTASKATAKPVVPKAPAKKAVSPTPAKQSPAKAAAKAPAKEAPAKEASAKGPAKKAAAKEAPAKAASGPSKVASPFDAKFLEAQRKLLLEERAKLLGQAEHLDAEAAQLMEDLDPGDVQFDEESGEGDTLAVERERDLALSAQARAAVEAIDAALERIEQGTYGICAVSGLPIPQERLEAIPWAAERVEYKAGSFRY